MGRHNEPAAGGDRRARGNAECAESEDRAVRKSGLRPDDAGVNINSIREFVGHADEQTTLHNYCYDRKSQQEKLDQVEKALAV